MFVVVFIHSYRNVYFTVIEDMINNISTICGSMFIYIYIKKMVIKIKKICSNSRYKKNMHWKGTFYKKNICKKYDLSTQQLQYIDLFLFFSILGIQFKLILLWYIFCFNKYVWGKQQINQWRK